MFQHIKKLKEKYKDSLLFIRIGDFYEVYEQDALTVSKELDLTLTSRSIANTAERIPMAGVPYHTLEVYIKNLIDKGYKVAVAENLTKGEAMQMPKREVASEVTLDTKNKQNKENKKMEQTNKELCYSEEECKEIVGQSKELFHEYLSKGMLKKILCTVGQNGRYTLNNTLFMLNNAPNISIVKNMMDWAELGRSIIPNSDSIEIMSPIKEERVVESLDSEEPVLDENGQPKKYSAIIGFKPTYVFDISNTIGNEYKPFAISDKITDEQKFAIYNGLRYELSKRGFKIDFVDSEELDESESGKVDRSTKKVKIKKGMSNYATVLNLLHFSANALAGAARYRDFEGLKGDEAYMLENSCMDCVLSAHFGMDTSKFDFSFTKAWNDEEKAAFYSNANLVCSTSVKLIESIERSFEYMLENNNQQNATASKDNPNRPSLFRGTAAQSEAEAF